MSTRVIEQTIYLPAFHRGVRRRLWHEIAEYDAFRGLQRMVLRRIEPLEEGP